MGNEGLSSSGETAVLTPLTTTAYVSLHTADPGNTGTSEISGGAYARQGPITFANAGNNPTVASNSAIITYPAAIGELGHESAGSASGRRRAAGHFRARAR